MTILHKPTWRKGLDPLFSDSFQEENRRAELLTEFLSKLSEEQACRRVNIPALRNVTEDRGYSENEAEYARKKLAEHGVKVKPVTQGGGPNKSQLQQNARVALVTFETYWDALYSLSDEEREKFLAILEQDEQYRTAMEARFEWLGIHAPKIEPPKKKHTNKVQGIQSNKPPQLEDLSREA